MKSDKLKYNVGIGLQPSTNDSEYNMGHMWIRWANPFTNEVAHRGYWPVLDDLPANLPDDKVRNYLCNNKVRGVYKIDTHGQQIERTGQEHKNKSWNFSGKAYFLLTAWHCNLPDGASFRESGMYSCDESQGDTHNCCSWAITVLRLARKQPNFIRCDRIKRLKYVLKAIWGRKRERSL